MTHALSISPSAGASPLPTVARSTRGHVRSRLADVSHDLKDPLAAIELALDFALEQEWMGDASSVSSGTMSMVRRQLAAAHRAAQRMRRLIVTTLDRPDLELEREPPPAPPVAPIELLTEIVEQYGAAARANGITLDHSCSAELPALRVRADPMLRALGNLIGNALKFTPAGGRVSVCASATPRGITITVADTGPGLSTAAQANLFRRFWQAPDTAHLGSGAGLLIARMLVEEEGGTIGFRDGTTRGAEFWITLPAHAAASMESSR